MTRYDLIVWDLDGTLADTKLDLASAANHALSTLGLPTHPPDRIASFVGGGIPLLLKRALGERGTDEALLAKAVALFRPWYQEHLLDATRAYPGIDDVVAEAGRAGVRQAVATNKARTFTAGIVETLFPGKFDPVVACGDDAPRKPDPTCVALCRARHPEVPPGRIVFVGDTLVDVETARAAGIDVVCCSWGFGARAVLEAAGPRWLVDRPGEIADLVMGRRT